MVAGWGSSHHLAGHDPHAESSEFGARSKWLMRHRQRAAHHVPTGAEEHSPRTPDHVIQGGGAP